MSWIGADHGFVVYTWIKALSRMTSLSYNMCMMICQENNDWFSRIYLLPSRHIYVTAKFSWNHLLSHNKLLQLKWLQSKVPDKAGVWKCFLVLVHPNA